MQREAMLPDGFGDKIYQAADAGEIDPRIAPFLVRSFLRGGLDTTSSAISAALWYLAKANGRRSLRANGRDVDLEAIDLDYTGRDRTYYATGLTRDERSEDDGMRRIIEILARLNDDGEEPTTEEFKKHWTGAAVYHRSFNGRTAARGPRGHHAGRSCKSYGSPCRNDTSGSDDGRRH